VQMLQAACLLHKQLLAFVFVNHPRFSCALPPSCHGHMYGTHRIAVQHVAFLGLFCTSRILIWAETPAAVTAIFGVFLSLLTLDS